MKVVLSTAPEKWLSKMNLPSLGLLYIGTALEKAGVTVTFMDTEAMGIGENLEELADAIVQKTPAIVGLTGNTHNRFNVIRLLQQIKKKAPEIIMVVGGCHFGIRHVAVDAVRRIPEIDIAVVGEGEFAMLEIAEAVKKGKISFSNISGIVYRNKSGEVIAAPSRPAMTDHEWQEFDRPAWHLVDHGRYNALLEGTKETRCIGIRCTRGCPNNCVFCANVAMGQRGVRRRNPSRVVDEIEFLQKEYGYSGFDIWDDTFTADPHYAYAFCEEIIARKVKIVWYARCAISQPYKDMHLLEAMRKAGCVAVGFGIESGNMQILKNINADRKNISQEAIKTVIRQAVSLGMLVKCFFIYSHPGESEKELKDTLMLKDELDAINPMVKSAFLCMRIYPGTKIEEIAINNGILPVDFSWNVYQTFPASVRYGQDDSVPLFEDKMSIEEMHRVIAQHDISAISRTAHDRLPCFAKSLLKKASRLIRRANS